MSAYSALVAALIFVVAGASIVACGPSDNSDDPPTGQELAAYCADVARTRNAMADVRDALLPLDEVAMQDARANARASIDYLEGSAFELQGGSDQVGLLKQDINDLLEIMASPSLVSVTDDLRAQVEVISTDLDQLEAVGNCP